MEHRLITGGEQFLPFARSCIAKLKKLGLPYADQSYEVDGASIKVRVTPGHEYIRIEGGGELLMDSGVVDLGPVYSTPYASCALYPTSTNTLYEAPFTTPRTRTDKVRGTTSVWKSRPGPNSSGQFAGDVTGSGPFKGLLPPAGMTPRSFERAYVKGETGAFSQAAIDDMLVQKKLAAFNCPASTFTGKCRLYVQAMYGAHLYSYDKGVATPGYVPRAVPTTESGASPHLLVKAYAKPGDAASYPDVTVDTSTGVYLDRTTGKHWLIKFNPGGTGIDFYPLVGTSERMRRHLVTGAAASAVEEDRDHLEAYILSSCLPDVANKQTVLVSGLPHAYSLGYGWHWSWSTGVADIVVIDAKVYNEGISWTLTTEGQYYVQTSHHHRLTVTPPGAAPHWEAALATVGSPVEWNVYRNFWCILRPDWALGGFEKATLPFAAVRAKIFNADAPIYAFYKRDTLQVARLKITTSYPGPDVITYSNDCLVRTPTPVAGMKDLYSYGQRSEFVEKKGGGSNNVDGGRRVEVVFSCGGYTAPVAMYNFSEAGWRTEVSGKSLTGARDSGTVTYSGGRLGAIYPGDTPEAPTVTISGVAVEMTYSISNYSVTEYSHGTLVAVVPRGDAEAMYLRSESSRTRTETPTDGWSMTSTAFATWVRLGVTTLVKEYDVLWYDGSLRYSVWSYTWVDPGPSDTDLIFRSAMTYTHVADTLLGTFTPPGSTVVTSLGHEEVFISSVSLNVDFSDIYEAHDDTIENISAYTFTALSGTSTETPTIFTPGRAPPVGCSSVATPAIVGWV